MSSLLQTKKMFLEINIHWNTSFKIENVFKYTRYTRKGKKKFKNASKEKTVCILR